MAEIKSLSSIEDKWTRVTPQRQQDYTLGIENPRRDWATETEAAGDNWKTGVDQAAAKGMFEKGVRAAGSDKWSRMAKKKGPTRFAEGVYIAGPDFRKGFAPFHAAIESADLGPRFPKRDPRNLERVRKIVDVMVKTKEGA